MKIKRAVKCAGIESQIKNAIEVAQRANIFGLEIQALSSLIKKYNFQERGQIIIDTLNGYPISSLSYHSPIALNNKYKNVEEVQKHDLTSNQKSFVFKQVEETIKEAAFVGKALKIKNEIPIIVHLSVFVEKEKINIRERQKKLKAGEETLGKLKIIADKYSKEFGVQLVMARENRPANTFCKNGFALIDLSPEDTISATHLGIGTVLDFAHIWITILCYQHNKTKLPNIDLNKSIYPNVDLEHIIDLLAPSLKVLHLNDAGPETTKEFEGLEIGTGNVPHKELIPLIHKKVKNDIIGTYEIIDGHIHPEKIYRSDLYYRNLFKDKFDLYFE